MGNQTGQTLAAALTDELARERTRLDTAQRLYVGFDFEYTCGPDIDEEKTPVVLLQIPKGVRLGADFRAFLDAAAEVPHD
jgi:hypothetical protein